MTKERTRNALSQAAQFKVAKYLQDNIERFPGRSLETVTTEISETLGIKLTVNNVKSIAHNTECEWWKSSAEETAEQIRQMRVDIERLKYALQRQGIT